MKTDHHERRQRAAAVKRGGESGAPCVGDVGAVLTTLVFRGLKSSRGRAPFEPVLHSPPAGSGGVPAGGGGGGWSLDIH